ncbi:hypothetical protein HK100_011659 [Physocladia obscura]|uniref:Uncharacterized protein n=1 Tax=Physocladia obscura TaxID=109957 RepID=A0AAD5XGT6_9FUNG|nr:hypothetical protein HK100_011659 [Physocladia obscura]
MSINENTIKKQSLSSTFTKQLQHDALRAIDIVLAFWDQEYFALCSQDTQIPFAPLLPRACDEEILRVKQEDLEIWRKENKNSKLFRKESLGNKTQNKRVSQGAKTRNESFSKTESGNIIDSKTRFDETVEESEDLMSEEGYEEEDFQEDNPQDEENLSYHADQNEYTLSETEALEQDSRKVSLEIETVNFESVEEITEFSQTDTAASSEEELKNNFDQGTATEAELVNENRGIFDENPRIRQASSVIDSVSNHSGSHFGHWQPRDTVPQTRQPSHTFRERKSELKVQKPSMITSDQIKARKNSVPKLYDYKFNDGKAGKGWWKYLTKHQSTDEIGQKVQFLTVWSTPTPYSPIPRATAGIWWIYEKSTNEQPVNSNLLAMLDDSNITQVANLHYRFEHSHLTHSIPIPSDASRIPEILFSIDNEFGRAPTAARFAAPYLRIPEIIASSLKISAAVETGQYLNNSALTSDEATQSSRRKQSTNVKVDGNGVPISVIYELIQTENYPLLGPREVMTRHHLDSSGRTESSAVGAPVAQIPGEEEDAIIGIGMKAVLDDIERVKLVEVRKQIRMSELGST